MGNTKKIKVILLLAGYLFVVLSHIVFVQPQKADGGNLAGDVFAFISKNHSGFGKGIINVKKLYESVVNRDFSSKQVSVTTELNVAILLYDVSWSTLPITKSGAYLIPINELPVNRCYYLRI